MSITSIKKELVVEASQLTAFKVFTEKMDLWWPSSHHIGQSPLVESVLEPHVNGRWYTKHEDGSEVNVGRVLQWSPFESVVLNWQINGNYQYDPKLTTEIEVKFIPENPKVTRVYFEHMHLERMAGPKALEDMNEGWGMIMELYRTYINSSENEN
jgi:hypothetical protein